MKKISLIALTALLGAITETAKATTIGTKLTPIDDHDGTEAPKD